MGQRPERGRRKPTPTSYAGRIPCLRCDKPFESWDRRQNRLCDACGQAIEEQPSEEPPYLIPEPRHLPPRAR
jgi:predicted amidophosphoribosyltransferase